MELSRPTSTPGASRSASAIEVAPERRISLCRNHIHRRRRIPQLRGPLVHRRHFDIAQLLQRERLQLLLIHPATHRSQSRSRPRPQPCRRRKNKNEMHRKKAGYLAGPQRWLRGKANLEMKAGRGGIASGRVLNQFPRVFGASPRNPSQHDLHYTTRPAIPGKSGIPHPCQPESKESIPPALSRPKGCLFAPLAMRLPSADHFRVPPPGVPSGTRAPNPHTPKLA